MYPEKKGGSHKMARPQQNWGLLTLLTRWASIWTMPNTASPKYEPPWGRAIYTPVRATILDHPPQKTAPGGPVPVNGMVFLRPYYMRLNFPFNIWIITHENWQNCMLAAQLIYSGSHWLIYRVDKRVSEWLSLTAFLGTADIRVHIVHASHVIITYTLESLSSPT